jgi:hypothetical protein
VALGPVLAQRNPPADALERLRTDLGFRTNEMEILCGRPLLFHCEAVFQHIYGLKGKIAYFLGVLAEDAPRAVAYARAEFRRELDLAGSAVFREVERLLAKV